MLRFPVLFVLCFYFLFMGILGCESSTRRATRSQRSPAVFQEEIATSLRQQLKDAKILNAVSGTFDESGNERIVILFRNAYDSLQLAIASANGEFTVKTLPFSYQTRLGLFDVYDETLQSEDSDRIPYNLLFFMAEDDLWRSAYLFDLQQVRSYFVALRRSNEQLVESNAAFESMAEKTRERIRTFLAESVKNYKLGISKPGETHPKFIELPLPLKGTLSVDTWGEPEDFYRTNYLISVRDTSDDLVQVISGSTLMPFNDDGSLSLPQLRDINFDGYPDIEMCVSEAAGGQSLWQYSIYYPKLGIFAYNSMFQFGSTRPIIDSETQTIETSWWIGTGYRSGKQTYTLKNNKPVLVREEVQESDFDSGETTTQVYERQGDEMVLVLDRRPPSSSRVDESTSQASREEIDTFTESSDFLYRIAVQGVLAEKGPPDNKIAGSLGETWIYNYGDRTLNYVLKDNTVSSVTVQYNVPDKRSAIKRAAAASAYFASYASTQWDLAVGTGFLVDGVTWEVSFAGIVDDWVVIVTQSKNGLLSQK